MIVFDFFDLFEALRPLDSLVDLFQSAFLFILQLFQPVFHQSRLEIDLFLFDRHGKHLRTLVDWALNRVVVM